MALKPLILGSAHNLVPVHVVPDVYQESALQEQLFSC